MSSTLDGNHPPWGHPPADFHGSSRQMQVVIMVLTVINIIAAGGMATWILWDTRTACLERRKHLEKDNMAILKEKGEHVGYSGEGSRRGFGLEMEQTTSTSESSNQLIGGRELDTRAWWEMVPTIDFFPLILAVTLFVQGIMLAVVEGEGLSIKFFEGNCRFPSEVAWVALWITPYIVLSFTIEAAIRALSQPRFEPRSGRAVVYCILFALILTLLTWIPSRAMPENIEQDICSGELMSFVDQFAAGGLGLMAALLPIAIFMGGVVVMHLTKDLAIDSVEKMAIRRTIYFLIINVLQWILMVPNYALTAQNNPRYAASELATVVANIGGISAGGLYIYLRTKSGPAYIHEDGASIIDIEANRSEKDVEINVNLQKRRSTNDRSAVQSYVSEYSDTYTISDLPRSPTTSDHSDRESKSILRTPRSPTSIYSKGPRSSRAPSIFSQYTTHSFKRLGDEINNMIAGLRAIDPPTISRVLAPPTPRKPASHYTLFPPSADRPRTPLAPASKTVQVPIPARAVSRPPTRPSRAATPAVNLDRRQSNHKLLDRVQSTKSNETPQTLQVPKPVARANSNAGTHPAKPFEVAIPPSADNGDAESFMEILIWKKDKATGVEGGRV